MSAISTIVLKGVSIAESHPEIMPKDGDVSYRVINYLDEPGDGHSSLPVFEVYKAEWAWRTYDSEDGPVAYLEIGNWKWAYSGGCPDGEISLERALEEYRRHQQYSEEVTGTVKKSSDLGAIYGNPELREEWPPDAVEELDQLF